MSVSALSTYYTPPQGIPPEIAGQIKARLNEKIACSPFLFAIIKGNYSLVKCMHSLDPNHPPDRDGETPLMWAAFMGNLDIFQFLYEEGKEQLSAKNTQGQSALDLAKQYGHVAIVNYIHSKTEAEK